MINEGRGISDLNKIETESVYKLFIDNGYGQFQYSFLGKEIELIFSNGEYYGSCEKRNSIFFLTFRIPSIYDELKLKTTITHELTHLIEIIQIEDKGFEYPKYNKIKRSIVLYKPTNKYLAIFLSLIYKTLDNEVNANVSQTYTYLKSFRSKDIDFLKQKLEEYSVRKDYLGILTFGIDKFKYDVRQNNISFDDFNNVLIQQGVGDFLDFVRNKSDDIKYIDSWFKLMKSNSSKFLLKQERIIKEVIIDLDRSDNYSENVSENLITKFSEYIKEYSTIKNK